RVPGARRALASADRKEPAQPHGGLLLGQPPERARLPLASAHLRTGGRAARQLAAEHAPKTANGYLGTLRSVLREAKRMRLLDPGAFAVLTDQPPVRGEALPAGRHVRPDELDRLFAYLDRLEGATGARDRAAFALLRGTGIR